MQSDCGAETGGRVKGGRETSREQLKAFVKNFKTFQAFPAVGGKKEGTGGKQQGSKSVEREGKSANATRS